MTKSNKKKHLFIAELNEGRQVNDLFLVSRKIRAETKTGKPYLALTLMDRTGEIEGRVWDNVDRFDEQSAVGNVITLHGTAKSFRDQLQLTITTLHKVDENAFCPGDFMPASTRAAADMKSELQGLIDGIEDQPLHRLSQHIFQGRMLEQFATAPAAKRMHHAYIGGLIEHTLSVTGLALKMSDHYPQLDRNLLIAGALLHDIGKIREFSYAAAPFEYTDEGRLIGHMVMGSEMVRNAAKTIPEYAQERLDQLIHLILSHHGRYEFGSPCLPMTVEAIILHHCDDMDAKMNYIGRLSEQVDEDRHQWSDYQRPLERFLLLRGHHKQNPAPPDEKKPALPPNQKAHNKDRPSNHPEKPTRQQSLFE